MNTTDIKYVIISPVRDEQQFVEQMIQSVAQQTIRPTEWILVDDGSTDRTAAIIDQCARKYSWIRTVHRPNRGFRKSGGGVVEAFRDGYSALRFQEWDFIVKLDGDLILGEQYFQLCLERFRKDCRLGIGGGMISSIRNGNQEFEECPRFHVRGATKIYRRKCWEDIGGLLQAPGWDTVDELKAQMLGWKSESFEEIRIVQQRPTGRSNGLWTDLLKNGQARYVAGYHPLFLLASCTRRLMRRPYLIGSVGLLWGFLFAYIRRIPQVNDPALIAYVRHQQLRRLFGLRTIWQ